MMKNKYNIEYTSLNGTNIYYIEILKGHLKRGFSNMTFNGVVETVTSYSKKKPLNILCVNASTFDVNNGRLRGTNKQGNNIFYGDRDIFGRTYLIYNEKENILYSSDNVEDDENIAFSLIGFFSLIDNGVNVIDKYKKVYPFNDKPNPQQIIFQKNDNSFGFLTVEGRVFNQRGLTINECCSFLLNKNDIRFAYLLDGGGSVSTVINGRMLNNIIEKEERAVKDFLYFEE